MALPSRFGHRSERKKLIPLAKRAGTELQGKEFNGYRPDLSFYRHAENNS